MHHIGARAEHKVEQELLDDLKRVGGKHGLLFNLTGAAVEKPDGTIREVLFPVVGEQTLHDLVREKGDRAHLPHDAAPRSAAPTAAITGARCWTCWPPSTSVRTTTRIGR